MTPPRGSNETNALIHLYRGELGRMTAYRVRLDTTSNWAVVTTAGIVTFALGNEAVPHAVFLFAMLLTLFFLNLEAHRFRLFETTHQRVRLLERGFYTELLGGDALPDWQQALRTSLEQPESPISRLEALGWRLRRTYLLIYAALLMAWWGKLVVLHPEAQVAFADAGIGPLSGGVVIILVGLFYLLLIALALLASRRNSTLEAD
jgi:uncharacterized membrane protein